MGNIIILNRIETEPNRSSLSIRSNGIAFKLLNRCSPTEINSFSFPLKFKDLNCLHMLGKFYAFAQHSEKMTKKSNAMQRNIHS